MLKAGGYEVGELNIQLLIEFEAVLKIPPSPYDVTRLKVDFRMLIQIFEPAKK